MGMKTAAIAAVAAVTLSGCMQMQTPQEQACSNARTYGERFGTPERRGPCWGPIISTSATGNIRSYMVQINTPGYAVATLTYDGNTLVQAGQTRGW